MKPRELQRRVLDMAFKHKDLYSADKPDLTGTILHPAWIEKSSGIEDIKVDKA
ncbi:MAG: hypothetical protein JRI86_11460 [Deltaproteobacteria bacterium]|nr:hypothetical protein [Deltaproteobacteria bacterium]